MIPGKKVRSDLVVITGLERPGRLGVATVEKLESSLADGRVLGFIRSRIGLAGVVSGADDERESLGNVGDRRDGLLRSR